MAVPKANRSEATRGKRCKTSVEKLGMLVTYSRSGANGPRGLCLSDCPTVGVCVCLSCHLTPVDFKCLLIGQKESPDPRWTGHGLLFASIVQVQGLFFIKYGEI